MDEESESSSALDAQLWADLSNIDEIEDYEKEYKPHKIDIISVDSLIETEPEDADQIIKNIFDRGDKLAVIGPSKTKKSFFLMELAFSLATGTKFFDFEVPKPRKVLLVQYEIQPRHFHRRIKAMAYAIGIDATQVSETFHAINARGKGIELIEIQKIVEDGKYDVVILDPLYKLFAGNENDSEVVKEILKIFDNIVTQSGAALVFSHHDRKGSNGKQELTDRGSGAGIIGRDYDAAMFLSEHASGKDFLNFDFVLRNYVAPEPRVLEWFEYCFKLSDLEPMDKKAGSRAQKSPQDLTQKALELLGYRKISISAFRDEVQTRFGLTLVQQRSLISKLFEEDLIREFREKSRKGNSKFIERVQKDIIKDDVYF